MDRRLSTFTLQFSSVVIAGALLLGTCSPAPEAQTQTAGRTEDIPVGVYAALTGDQAAFGQATVEGVRLAADEINASGGILGRKIRLVVEDDQGRADEAASAVTKLITSDNV